MNVNRCAHQTQCVSRLFAPFLTQKKKNTDAITSDSPSRHLDELTNVLSNCAKDVVRGNCSKSIKAYFLNHVKVDIVNYRYRWIDEPVISDGVRLASPKDIAAMKVNAVMGRGTKKDFVDMYFLLRHYTFDEIMQFYLQKYTDGSEYRALLSMNYFADADPQPMPFMYQQVEWDTIKDEIKHQVEMYNQSITGQ